MTTAAATAGVTRGLAEVGTTWDAGVQTWGAADTLLYALAVGAGCADLAFTTENTSGIDQQVLPTFPVVLQGDRGQPPLGGFPLSSVLHAEQAIELNGPVPVCGTATLRGTLIAVHDKGRDAHLITETVVTDTASQRRIAVMRAGIFVRGAGGFGGERGSATPWQVPERAADEVVRYDLPLGQALLYRLTGDRNPLHSDPAVAAEAGFAGPILHGLCTFGYTGRALLRVACDGLVERFGAISARFSAPVFPGQTLTVHVWQDDGGGRFRTYAGETLVLDRGAFRLRA